uniref:MFS transporter n=1 Tax=Thermodesulfobacterium geofontis TaxID=1295609 RepID=A0A7V5K239_9BACT
MEDLKVLGMKAESGRWLYVVFGLIINICLGAIYAFSIFRPPLEKLWGISATQSGLPFMVFLAMFALTMPFAGNLIQKWGPRNTMFLGALLVGIGWIAASFSPDINTLTLLYGVIGGAGVGVMYGAPIATSAKWFPDRGGLAIGLTVGGFGLSALVTAPIIKQLIGMVGPLSTFLYLGIAFLIILIILSIPYKFPPEGWKPEGFVASTSATSSLPGIELDRGEMIKTISFWALWLTYTIGCLAGLMAIGISAPAGKEVGLTAETAALAVSLYAIFNFLGRPFFGALTDKIKPKASAILSFLIIGIACLLIYGVREKIIFVIGFCLLWFNLGGWLAIAPTATKIFYGTKFYGKNYGLVFTAYGAGAIAGVLLSGRIKDLTGSYFSVFPIVAGLCLLGIIISIIGLKPPKTELK